MISELDAWFYQRTGLKCPLCNTNRIYTNPKKHNRGNIIKNYRGLLVHINAEHSEKYLEYRKILIKKVNEERKSITATKEQILTHVLL